MFSSLILSLESSSFDTVSAKTKGWKQRTQAIVRRLWRSCVEMNMFKSPLRRQPADIKQQRWMTRIHILCLCLGVVILAFYAILNAEKKSIQVNEPAIETAMYLQSQSEFNSSLRCPCANINTPIGQLLHIQPVYHQVCSSDFVNRDGWIFHVRALLQAYISDIPEHSNDFRNCYQSFFLLASMCNLIIETVATSLQRFEKSQFVTNQLLSLDFFENQVNTIVKEFQNELTSTSLRFFRLTRNVTYINQYFTYLSADVQISDLYAVFFTIRSYTGADHNSSYTCSCANDIRCKTQLGLYDPQYSSTPYRLVPGLYRACFTFESLLLSTLECFYDDAGDCLSNVTGFYQQDWFIKDLTLLNSSRPSRFKKNSIIDILFSELFIEYWEQSLNYSSYFAGCQPMSCSYEIIRRNSVLESTTVVLGLVGGLSVSLRILIPLLGALYRAFARRRQLTLSLARTRE